MLTHIKAGKTGCLVADMSAMLASLKKNIHLMKSIIDDLAQTLLVKTVTYLSTCFENLTCWNIQHDGNGMVNECHIHEPAVESFIQLLSFSVLMHLCWSVNVTACYRRGNVCHCVLANGRLQSLRTVQVWTFFSVCAHQS